LQILAEFIFTELTYEEIVSEFQDRVCKIPILSTELEEELKKCNIRIFKNSGGYYQITVFSQHYLSLNFLALFLRKKERPAIGTEISHHCNRRDCCAIGHIEELPWQDNQQQQHCQFIVKDSGLEKSCSCNYELCCPLKFITDSNSTFTFEDLLNLRTAYLPLSSKPIVNRRFEANIWPCGVCGRITTDFQTLWSHVNGHKRCGANARRALLADPKSLTWKNAFEFYNNYQVFQFIILENDLKKLQARERKRIQRENYLKRKALRSAADTITTLT